MTERLSFLLRSLIQQNDIGMCAISSRMLELLVSLVAQVVKNLPAMQDTWV